MYVDVFHKFCFPHKHLAVSMVKLKTEQDFQMFADALSYVLAFG